MVAECSTPFSGFSQRFFFCLAYLKVVAMRRIGWSACAVLGGRHTPFWVVAMRRFMHKWYDFENDEFIAMNIS